jgi:hypothetical protein
VALFLDGPALARVYEVLHQADDILPAPDLRAAA